MTSVPVHCPDCQGVDVVRYGKQRHGPQRYRCNHTDCPRHIFLLAYRNHGRLPAVKHQMVDMALNGSGIRDTARVLRVSPTTVITTLKKKRQAYSKSIDIIVNKPIDQKVVELSSSQRYSLVENSMYHAVFLLKAYKMTFSYNQVKERPKLFLAMTGLTHAEFEQLLPHFQGALDQYVQDNYIDRDKRQRQYGGGKPESTLITIEDKLLFILYYVKVYPLQEILAFEFDMVQRTANEWIHILSGV